MARKSRAEHAQHNYHDASSTEWEPLNEHQVYKSELDGKVVIVAPKNHDELTIPLFCDICQFTIKTQMDVEAFKTAECCSTCKKEFGETPNPDRTSDAFDEYIAKRENDSCSIINIV